MRPERLYAGLLKLYPPAFRREYGDQMIEAFLELERKPRQSSTRFWLFVLADTCASASRERIETWRTSVSPFAARWVVGCALGAIVTALLANALTWSFGYLYHPYLEGLTLPAWSYGALLGLGLGAAQTVALLRRFHLGAWWIVSSAAATAIGLHIAVRFASLTGPLGYGLVLGGFLGAGQWLVLRTRIRRAGWWVLASAVALSVSVLSCGAALHVTLQGLNPLSHDPAAAQAHVGYGRMLGVLVRAIAIAHPTNWMELALECGATAASGLIFGAVTAKPLSSMLARAR